MKQKIKQKLLFAYLLKVINKKVADLEKFYLFYLYL